MNIQEEEPTTADVHALILEHLADVHASSPPESAHALHSTALKAPGIIFWSVRDKGVLQGCGALNEPDLKTSRLVSLISTLMK